MSRPNNRLETSEDAAAYRVASLLRQAPHSASRDVDTNSLRSMTSQIERFLATAPQVPAVRMEPEWMQVGDGSGHGNEEAEGEGGEGYGAQLQCGSDQQPVVQLSVVAGVLEEQDVAYGHGGGGVSRVDGVVLPTAENQQELHRRKVEQAQAMLNLMSALAPLQSDSGGGGGVRGEASPDLSTRVVQHPSSSDDDDEVAVMDADDLDNEDSSDDDMPVQRRRIQEMN